MGAMSLIGGQSMGCDTRTVQITPILLPNLPTWNTRKGMVVFHASPWRIALKYTGWTKKQQLRLKSAIFHGMSSSHNSRTGNSNMKSDFVYLNCKCPKTAIEKSKNGEKWIRPVYIFFQTS